MQPRVKHIANFWRIVTITGRNMVKEIKMEKLSMAKSKPKYIMDFPEGRVLAANWKFPWKIPHSFWHIVKLEKKKINEWELLAENSI